MQRFLYSYQLRPYDRSVGTSHVVEVTATLVVVRVFSSKFFVYVDTKSWLTVRPHEPVLNSGCTREFFFDLVAVNRFFLNTEV
tara:strand:- start:313 stop:561 length:249 start_codon:yes stop_codon:yes gene_type:complete